MAGYTRQDTADNIANGKIIDADDLDSEFDAVESAFNSTTGHNHDGTTGEGARITAVGPAGEMTVTSTAIQPASDNALDLGTSSIEMKDGFFDGTLKTDVLTVDETSTFTGAVTASAAVSVGTTLAVTGEATFNNAVLLSSAAPKMSLTDTSTNVDHSVDGNSGVGNLFIRVDENSEGSDPKLIVAVAGTTALTAKATGNVDIAGALAKGSGSFRIDHPLKAETHHLVHSFVEAPQADNIYRGKVSLVAGAATVNLDAASRMTEGTFVALNGNIQCFTANEGGWTALRGSVSGNTLTIEAQDDNCTDSVSWLVIGERHDQHMLDTDWTDANGRVITEPEKAS
jgi:hypothetical protein